uniref:cGMP-dependent protein kinase n=1 Tax=Gasterosteus aculeatus aculeatus TaxID=481459 RepID=A0AAQ4RY88_GASAC
RLQEKERLLQELNGQYDELGKEVGAGDTDEVTFDTTFSRRHLQLMRCADFFHLRCPLSDLIVKAIQKNDFLSRLDDEQTAMMVDLLAVSSYKPNDDVIKEGTEGDSMYIVAAGELLVTQAGQTLRSLTTGDVFGELAILYNCRRTATVKAKTAVRLWCMERQTYRTIITNKSKKKREQLLGFLKTLVHELCNVIVREGAEANAFYIILKGEVRCSIQIRRMGKGEHFGEQALIREVLRTATCSAEGPVTCLSIDKDRHTIPPLHLFLWDPVTLGVGGFGRVELVTTVNHEEYYAMKRVSKKHIVAKRQEEHMLFEKKILKATQCNFIVSLHAAFKDTRYIYMVMEFCVGGEIWTKLKEVGRFDEPIAMFCTACVVEAYAYLHKKNIMYRDLKPENLMLDIKGYVKLVDFGFSKEMVHGDKTYSFVGTPEYMAPEIIKNQGHDFAVDFWSLGVLIYELLVGSPPFSSSEPQKIYAKILDGVLKYPPYMNKYDASNLL